MHFSLTLPDGTQALSTYDETPFAFSLGDGRMAEILELALIGLSAGDEQQLEVSGDEVYGSSDPENLQWMARDQFPPEMALSEGQMIGFSTDAAEEIAGIVKQIEATRILIDFNHPLSGTRFLFKASILEVTPAEQVHAADTTGQS
jgi:FKBP-type peptidyl-prolyl cis-trans isomerase SlpA